jgi:F-type H+-transporting ATPase subunit a
MSADSIHISIVPETILKLDLPVLGSLAVTNSMLATTLILVILCLLAVIGGATLKKTGKPNRFQIFLEMFYGFLEGASASNLGSKSKARKYMGLAVTLFLFIVLGSWFGLLPGVMQITAPDLETGVSVPVLRAPTTDINATIALSLVAVFVTQAAGFMALGFFGYSGKFINFKGGLMGIFVGFLELISEFSRILSYSFRLFGNIFAGEVLLVLAVYFTKNVWLPLPTFVILMETVVAMIQGYVFISLMTVFIKLATESHEEHAHQEVHSNA